MGAPIPFENQEVEVSSTSTLFKHMTVQCYYSSNSEAKMTQDDLKQLKKLSKGVGEDKRMFLNLNWKYFFTQLVEDIEINNNLQK